MTGSPDVTRLVGAEAGVDDVVRGLERDGVVILEAAVDDDVVAGARAALETCLASTPTGRNDFEGFHTRRVYSALAKTRALDPLALHPVVLGVADRVLRHHWISATVGISIEPGEAAQVVHHDDGVYPLRTPHADLGDVMVSTMWALDDFTAENGATVLFPGTHRDPQPPPPDRAPVLAVMPAGSVAVYLGTLWHHGGANRSDRRRLGLTFEYVASWLRQQENQVLAIPPAAAGGLPGRLPELLGYDVYPPFLGYVDGRSPKRLVPR